MANLDDLCKCQILSGKLGQKSAEVHSCDNPTISKVIQLWQHDDNAKEE